jgi:hypothetical protein
LGKIDANTALIFVKFDKIEFDSNFRRRSIAPYGWIFARQDMVTAMVICRRAARTARLRQLKFHHDRRMAKGLRRNG